MDRTFLRKLNRLPPEMYQGRNAYYVTICTFAKQKYFQDKNIVEYLLNILKDLSLQEDFSVLAYVFMPDHCHLLLNFGGKGNLINAVKKFKQFTGYYFKRKTEKPLWERSFYDHVVREEDDLNKIMQYILDNPVRAKLVREWDAYPFSGSFQFDVRKLTF